MNEGLSHEIATFIKCRPFPRGLTLRTSPKIIMDLIYTLDLKTYSLFLCKSRWFAHPSDMVLSHTQQPNSRCSFRTWEAIAFLLVEFQYNIHVKLFTKISQNRHIHPALPIPASVFCRFHNRAQFHWSTDIPQCLSKCAISTLIAWRDINNFTRLWWLNWMPSI